MRCFKINIQIIIGKHQLHIICSFVQSFQRKGPLFRVWHRALDFVGPALSVSQCQVASGTYVLFWKDDWSNGELICHKFPRLYSYALDEDISVADLAHVEDLNNYFALPMLVEAFQE
jgi:hypothetical protein